MTIGEFLGKLFSWIGYVFKAIGDLMAGTFDVLLGKTAIMDAQIVPFLLAALLLVVLSYLGVYLLTNGARHIFVWIRKVRSFLVDAVREEWRMSSSYLKPGLKALLVAVPVLLGIVMIFVWAARELSL